MKNNFWLKRAMLSALVCVVTPSVAHANVVGTVAGTMAASVGGGVDITDGEIDTFWRSAKVPTTADHLYVDYGSVQPVLQVDLYMTALGYPNDRIEQGVIEVSKDKITWTPIGSFAGQDEVHVTAPVGTVGRYIRVRPTANQSKPLVVREMAIDRPITYSSMGTLAGDIGNPTDRNSGSYWKSSGVPTIADWVKVDRGAELPLSTVSLSMTESGSPNDRISAGIIEISSDNNEWTSVGTFADTSEVRLVTPPGTTSRWVRVRPTANQSTPLVIKDFMGVIRQPAQPISGFGGGDYTNSYRVSSGGTGVDAWYVFEPITPQPTSAPLTIITHGYGDYSGYSQMHELIMHTVKKGSVVIYPRWQTGLTTPCAGSFNIEPCMMSALNGIRGALQFLQSDPARVQPLLDQTTYFGFSFGGILTSNLANRYASLRLPEPRAIFLDDPHDGGYAGVGEPGLDGSLAGIPATTKFVCHSGADGVIKEANKGGSSCNAIFPRLGHIPADSKDLVLLSTDTYGDPDLSSAHGVSAGTADAYDWYFVFKQWDALRNFALFGANKSAALGNTPERRALGLWTNGVPIKQLKIQQVAPIAP